MYSNAVFVASMVSLQGIKMKALEKVSVIVNMVSYVFDVGSSVMKSRAIDENGRVYISDEMGNKGIFIFVGLFFLDWHRTHPLT